jgi:hypothetical protein
MHQDYPTLGTYWGHGSQFHTSDTLLSPSQKYCICRDDAAKESNLPSRGLPDPAGFEDRMGHQARAAPDGMLCGR